MTYLSCDLGQVRKLCKPWCLQQQSEEYNSADLEGCSEGKWVIQVIFLVSGL